MLRDYKKTTGRAGARASLKAHERAAQRAIAQKAQTTLNASTHQKNKTMKGITRQTERRAGLQADKRPAQRAVAQEAKPAGVGGQVSADLQRARRGLWQGFGRNLGFVVLGFRAVAQEVKPPGIGGQVSADLQRARRKLWQGFEVNHKLRAPRQLIAPTPPPPTPPHPALLPPLKLSGAPGTAAAAPGPAARSVPRRRRRPPPRPAWRRPGQEWRGLRIGERWGGQGASRGVEAWRQARKNCEL